jgi:ApbE superfamily uncharacterized protein (UPF0280 family)
MAKKAGKSKKDPRSYRHRTYRSLAERSGLVSTFFRLKETDLHILAEADVTKAGGELAAHYRLQIEHYVENNPDFGSSLKPLPDDRLAPPIIRDMLAAARMSDVGPMAAVAGAISEYVCRGLIDSGQTEVIVENGGDIFLQRSERCIIAIFAGESPLSNRVGLQLEPEDMPLGICTSSGTVGHSLSFGAADSVTVLADSAALADAAATRLGNEVGTESHGRDGVDRALRAAENLTGLRGVLVVCGETMGAIGQIELIPLD